MTSCPRTESIEKLVNLDKHKLASPDIRPNSPKSSSDEETHILPQLAKRLVELEMKLVDDRWQDKSYHDLIFQRLRK